MEDVIFSGHYLLDDGGELDSPEGTVLDSQDFSSPVQDRTLPDLSIAAHIQKAYLSTA